jgi:hypothetical protein
MNEQIPFHDLICASCRNAAAVGERLPELDYVITDVQVNLDDGTQVTVPIDVREYDVEYQSAGRFAARILARVPCPSCRSSHAIDISATRRAPLLELQRAECPRCGNQSCDISAGPIVRYRETNPGDAWVEVSAEMKCASCGGKAQGTCSVDPAAFNSLNPSQSLPLVFAKLSSAKE